MLCTWNRAELLRGALSALAAQQVPPPHEIVVVDNASTDDTADVVHGYAAAHPQIRYVFEGKAGLSYARNAGVAHTTGALVAFTDDDVRVPADWLRHIAATADEHAAAACFGGPVWPQWPRMPPRWLTDREWGAIGAQSYGPEPFRVDHTRPVCLIGANLVFRRTALQSIGPFATAVQRVGNGIGSTEDDEYHRRLWASGGYGVYDPRLEVVTVLSDDRLSKRYHRRWQFGHGRHIARMRLEDMERARLSILGVPAHLPRQACRDLARVVRGYLERDPVRAFHHELRVWFAAGFVRERWWGQARLPPRREEQFNA